VFCMVGFPGLGLGEFYINPVALQWGDLSIRWYGVIIAVGFVLAMFYCTRMASRFQVLQDELLDMVLWVVPCGILGARALYVALSWHEFAADPVTVVTSWQNGGLAIYGAVIAGALVCVLFCRVRLIHPGALLDVAAFGLLIGQAVGRWGNFVNLEVYGRPTALPWRMSIQGREVHPLFLYECLWNLLGFGLLHLLIPRRRYNGQIFTAYVFWYGLGRMLLEPLRDDLYSLQLGGFPVMELLAALSSLAALALLLFLAPNKNPETLLAWTEARDERLVLKEAGKAARKSARKSAGQTGYDGSDDGSDNR